MSNQPKPFIEALRGKTQSTPPIWLMRQAGRYLPEYRELRSSVSGFLEMCYTPALAVEVTLQPIRRYGFDAAIIFSDILVVPDALGQDVSFQEGKGPVLQPVRSMEELDALRADGLHDHLRPVYEALAEVRSKLPDETALIGFAGAPWTVATYMVEGGGGHGFETVKGWAFGRPDEFQRLIDLLVEATSSYLIRQVESGAEALQIFDTWAGVLPEAAFDRWCVKPVAEITRRVRESFPEIPVIGFPRGTGVHYQSFAGLTGVNAVTLDSTVPRDWARAHVQNGACVQGNLDPIMLVAGGEAMEREVEDILSNFSDGPFVFNLGHGIIPRTPPENVARLVELVRRDTK